MFDSPTVSQNLVASVIVAYIAFCFFYGYTSLRQRRERASAATQGATFNPWALWKASGRATRLCCVFTLPVLLVSVSLSFAGRDRSGIIESTSLFTVAPRVDASVELLTDNKFVKKGEIVASFTSDAIKHRVAILEARRKELLATRDALKSSNVSHSSEEHARQRSLEQRLASVETKLVDIERSRFGTRQQLQAAKSAWEGTRVRLTSRLDALEQSLATEAVEHDIATRALDRITNLRDRGYATISQVDRVAVTASVAQRALTTTREAIASVRKEIATLDQGYEATRALLETELANMTVQAETLTEQRAEHADALTALRPIVEAIAKAAETRRQHEIAAADARLAQLENEIEATVAQGQVRSPVDGQVLFRNPASATLNGSLPLLVIAPNEGFLMRVDLMRDEIAALERDAAAGPAFEVVVDDMTVRRLVRARLIRIDDSGTDPKRATAVFGIEIPEDMLVRMALMGISPRGTLRWQPSTYDLASARVADVLGTSPGQYIARHLNPPLATSPASAIKPYVEEELISI